MDPAEFGAGAGSGGLYEYKNIVFQDFYQDPQLLQDESLPDHQIFLLLLPQEAGFTQPDFKIVYVKNKNCLLIQADRPSGGNRLCRLNFSREFQVPTGYQGDKTVAVFDQKGYLILTIPTTGIHDSQPSQSQTPDDNSDGAETEPESDPQAPASTQAESHLAPAAFPVPPPYRQDEYQRLRLDCWRLKARIDPLGSGHSKGKERES